MNYINHSLNCRINWRTEIDQPMVSKDLMCLLSSGEVERHAGNNNRGCEAFHFMSTQRLQDV